MEILDKSSGLLVEQSSGNMIDENGLVSPRPPVSSLSSPRVAAVSLALVNKENGLSATSTSLDIKRVGKQ